MNAAHRSLARLASFVAGQRCPGCDAPCTGWICPTCDASLSRTRLRCIGCAMPLSAVRVAHAANAPHAPESDTPPVQPPAVQHCGRCLSEPPPVAASHAAFDYAAPGDRLVHALKFRQLTALAAPLAARLAEALVAGMANQTAPSFDRVVPVPLSPGRERSRGYNQSWELARRLPSAWGPACWQTLVRTRDTASQMALPLTERERNVRGAFAVQRDVTGLHVLLVDDVMTTGATLFEAARCMRKAGARSVTALALARTP